MKGLRSTSFPGIAKLPKIAESGIRNRESRNREICFGHAEITQSSAMDACTGQSPGIAKSPRIAESGFRNRGSRNREICFGHAEITQCSSPPRAAGCAIGIAESGNLFLTRSNHTVFSTASVFETLKSHTLPSTHNNTRVRLIGNAL